MSSCYDQVVILFDLTYNTTIVPFATPQMTAC